MCYNTLAEKQQGGNFMNKRAIAVLIAGAVGASALLSACTFTPETPDEKAPAFSDAAATLTLSGEIDKTSEANAISADLFGLFLEDINFASFALDDNLLINSSFENKQTALSGGALHGWYAENADMASVREGGVLSGDRQFRNEDGSYVNEEHLKLTLRDGATLSNAGHPVVPIAVEAGTQYVFSAFIKGYTGNIGLSVRKGGDVYAESELAVSGNEWVKYRTTLTATGTAAEDLSFVMTFDGTGTVYLDNVMLETQDKNEATGIKRYLYEAIEALSPKFFRFPGGCIIEGTGTDEGYYDWKNSVGAVAAQDGDTVPAFTYTLREDGKTEQVTSYGEQATRTYNTNRWYLQKAQGASESYYQMEYGLGFYEYFLLCEELGAKAIPILNCGLSCQVLGGKALKGRHNNGIADFIQDAFDLIAFAKGDPASSDANEAYWAQVRVNMGHPEPFAMDYLGIGNEQWGEYYTDYYEKFLIAFAEADNDLYRSVRPIVGNCTRFGNCENPAAGRDGIAQEAAEHFLDSEANSTADGGFAIGSVAEYGVVDQHYYVNYTDLFVHHDLYDGYARPADDPNGYYDVFVGEYAANAALVSSDAGENCTVDVTKFNDHAPTESSWINALSEAAMMTGFERNGDIVKLAAYAPMFANLDGFRQWGVDMMYYTNTQLVRTPSYYVQQLFMHNSGDYKVSSELTFAAGGMPTLSFEGSGGASRTVDQLYSVTSMDKETGDILVKIVNAGETSVRLNVSLAGLTGVRSADYAQVYEVLGEEYGSVNELDRNGELREGVYTVPVHSIGAFTDGNIFGYEIAPLSVTAFRVRTR